MGKHQISSSPLPKLQGNTSLEILIKEASGCLILMLDSLFQTTAILNASSQFLYQGMHETDLRLSDKIKP